LINQLFFSMLHSTETGEEWEPISAYAHKESQDGGEVKYEGTFKVPISFGGVGAILVQNEHHKEIFLKNIVLVTGNDDTSKVTFVCDSWVHSKHENPQKRIFFSAKVWHELAWTRFIHTDSHIYRIIMTQF
jgi:lipoxygenase